jgi:HEAT repeat protein
MKILMKESEEVRLIAASSILKHSDSSAAIEVLESILKSTDVNHRLEALEILVKKDNLTTAEVVESIITVSDNSTPLIEKKAKILGLIKSEQAVDLLIELKEKTNDTGTIAKIVDAIANQGAFAEKVLPQLKELEQKYQNSSYSFNFKSAVEKVTISLMHSGNPEYLLDSVEILSSKWGEDKMSPEESVKLISSVENSSQELIIRKASMLGRIGSEQSTELLFELLKLEDNSVTATVILLAIEKQESISKSQKSELDELINKYSDDNSILFLIHELKEKM